MRLGQAQSALICSLAGVEVWEKLAVFGCVQHNAVVMVLGGAGALYLGLLTLSGVAATIKTWWERVR